MNRTHLISAIASALIVCAGASGAELLAWWPLDSSTEDMSGNGNHLELSGGADYVEGIHGEAVSFDGIDDNGDSVHSEGDIDLVDPGVGSLTAGAWIRLEQGTSSQNFEFVVSKGNPTSSKVGWSIWYSNSNNALIVRCNSSDTSEQRAAQQKQPVPLDEWLHVAIVIDRETAQVRGYLNGSNEGWIPGGGGPTSDSLGGWGDIGNDGPLVIGHRNDGQGTLLGVVDDVRIYSGALTEQEILIVMAGEPRPRASAPDPADGVVLEATWANLSWRAGDFAVSHDLYFGTSFDDVNDGVEGTLVGNLGGMFQVVGFPGFPAADGLQPGTTYYWRVDEVNDANAASPWKGNVWSFTVPSKKAYNPTPADGAKFIDPDVTLSWTKGFGAKLHSVYFGDNLSDVTNAVGAAPVAAATFTPGTLDMEKTYYWRVDEFDGANTHKGDVWSLTTMPVIPAHEDPDLVAWWTFDEGQGSTALDWSGHGNHAALFGSEWVTGAAMGEAALRVGDYGAIQNLSYADANMTEVSVTAWVRTSSAGNQYIVSFDRNEYYRLEVNGHGGGPGQVGWDVMTSSGQVDCGSVTRIDDGSWHHVAGVYDNGKLIIYIDGAAEPSVTGGQTYGSGNTRFGFIGANSEATGFNGSRGTGSPVSGHVDDIRIYHRALSQEEIVLVMRGDPLLAWAPRPADGSTPDIDNATSLNWSAGDDASSHEVYFGTDADTVKNADTSDTTGVYRGSQTGTNFTVAEDVEWGGGPYYWRIDEKNTDGTVTTGRVWTFSVADFVAVDDFERYTDNDADGEAIWQSWIDGFDAPANGSQVGYVLPPYTEQTIIHGGRQSMPLLYNNTGGVRNSEAVLALSGPGDWTRHGVEVLSLWFRGYPPSVGSFTEGPAGTFTMTGAGSDIWGTADEFHFAYKTLTGPGTIVARVDSVQNTHEWAKAGVMIRETLDPGSKHAFAVVSGASGIASQGRTDTDASPFGTTEAGISAPHWVKLERDVAGFFTVSHSTNGSSWAQVTNSVPTNIPMGSTVYIGLAVTSHNAAATCEAKFSNVTVTGNAGLQWANQDIGILANASEPLYVALSDTNGRSAGVTHEDSGAATTDTWTEWRINLQLFADQGVSLANIDKIAIGLGAQGDQAATGGSGTVFIDDVRLLRAAEAGQQ